MYSINDRIHIGIYFNGEEFPFERANALDCLHMSCSTKVAVPMLYLKLTDAIGWITNQPHILSDSTRITVVVRTSNSSTQSTYSFRLNSAKHHMISNVGASYEMDGYFDVPKYWHSSVSTPLEGSSNEVLQQIATGSDLKYRGQSTSDAQVWWPRNVQQHEWARRISERGYASDQSCMQLGLDLDGILVYQDISSMGTPTAKIAIGDIRPNTVIGTSFKPISVSGSMNHYSGYSSTHIEQNPLETKPFTQHTHVAFVKNEEGNLMVNTGVQRVVGQSRVSFASLSVGNVHENYERALYQNRRVNNLFSSGIEISTAERTEIQLLDTVQVSIDTPDQFMKVYSGTYRVASRVVYVVGNNYSEKFELFRRTLNAELAEVSTEENKADSQNYTEYGF